MPETITLTAPEYSIAALLFVGLFFWCFILLLKKAPTVIYLPEEYEVNEPVKAPELKVIGRIRQPFEYSEN